MNISEILGRLRNVRSSGQGEWMAACPAHLDNNASLHITDKGDALMLHCFAGCSNDAILRSLGLTWKDLPYAKAAQPGASAPRYGLTLARYSECKHIPASFLQQCGLKDGTRYSQSGRKNPGVIMPYMDANGEIVKIRWRMRMEKEVGSEPSRFLWERGGNMGLYGLWRQPPDRGRIIIVEGESDCHSLWYNGFPALGLPGAANYRGSRDDDILAQYGADDQPKIYIHIERDDGGKTVFRRFAGDSSKGWSPSKLLSRMRFFSLPGYKDPSDAWMHLYANPAEFQALITNALAAAVPADQYSQPASWNTMTANSDTAPKPPKPDGRAETSSANGEKGGRASAVYDLAAAEFFQKVATVKGGVALRYWRNAWYQYDGRCFHAAMDADIEALLMNYLQNQAFQEKYHLQPGCTALKNILTNLRSERFCSIPAALEAPVWLDTRESAQGWMAMDNCIIDIEAAAAAHAEAAMNGVSVSPEKMNEYTRPLSANLLSTFALNYPYIPRAQCPNFSAWLESTIPDPDLRESIIMLMGLSLVPDTSYSVCFFIEGEGGTGKSTFLEILRALVGAENTCHVPLLKFDDKFATWPLAECLLNIVGEMPSDDPLGRLRYIEGDFKDSVSGGDIHVERKGKDPCRAPCTARHVFATNSLPVFFDKSDGIWRRLIIIPFHRKFSETASEIRDYKKLIIPNELPGIFNLALAGLSKLRAYTRFPEPQACIDAKAAHRKRCDFDGTYLREYYKLVQDENVDIPVANAYKHYCETLMANGLAKRSSITFQSAVARVYGLQVSRRGSYDRTRVFKGLQPVFNSSSDYVSITDSGF